MAEKEAGVVREVDLNTYGREAIKIYGKDNLEDRHIADFRDGLKPVHRRILWAMHRMGLNNKKEHLKVARIVGDTQGKYHPHGDMSVYNAAVEMANSPQPLIDGSGNWGSMTDPAAAMRYIAGRMSEFANKNFFDERYLEVMDTVSNYDGLTDEPVILPSNIPYILLNGTAGIAVGVNARVPPFKPGGVAKLVSKALKGKEVTIDDCMETLKFNWPYGGSMLNEKKDWDQLRKFYETGVGTVRFQSDYKIDSKNRSIYVTSFPLGVKPENIKPKLEESNQNVQKVQDVSSKSTGPQWEIKLRSKIPQKDVEVEAEKIIGKHFRFSLNLIMNILEREKKEGDQVEAHFRTTTVPNLIHDWVDWRVGLETRMLEQQLSKISKDIRKQDVLVKGVENKDIVFHALQYEDDPDGYLADKLDLEREEADIILGSQVRRLHKLNTDKIKETKQNLNDRYDDLKSRHDKPAKSVHTELKNLMGGKTNG